LDKVFLQQLFEWPILYVYARCNAQPMLYIIEICIIKMLYVQITLLSLSNGITMYDKQWFLSSLANNTISSFYVPLYWDCYSMMNTMFATVIRNSLLVILVNAIFNNISYQSHSHGKDCFGNLECIVVFDVFN